jgi:hypothetical protein
MKRLLFSSSVVLLLIVLLGCGNENSSDAVDNTSVPDTLIDTEDEFYKKFHEYENIEEKSDYETQSEYANRLSQFANDEEVKRYKFSVTDSYDVETQTLYVYEHHIDYNSNSNTQRFDAGYKYASLYLVIKNMDSFPFMIGYAPSSIYQDQNRIYYKTNVSPENAERLHNKFYILIDNNLNTALKFTDREYSQYTGTKYFIFGNASFIQIKNSDDDTKIYDEYNVSLSY